jgi:hypothetical protein
MRLGKFGASSVSGFAFVALVAGMATMAAALIGPAPGASAAPLFPMTVEGEYRVNLEQGPMLLVLRDSGNDAEGGFRTPANPNFDITLYGHKNLSVDHIVLDFSWNGGGDSGRGSATISGQEVSGWMTGRSGKKLFGTNIAFNPPNPAGGGVGGAANGGGSSSSSAPAMIYNNKIVEFARASLGKCVKPGSDCQCTRLIEAALEYAGAQPGKDYVWGKEVTQAQMQPGDIIQFFSTEYTLPNGSWHTEIPGQHTAIIETVDGSVVMLIHQNDGEKITHRGLFGNSTKLDLNWTHSGTFKIYRASDTAFMKQVVGGANAGALLGDPVSVKLDVDVYARPGGVGEPVDMLAADPESVVLLEACEDNWCHVQWPGHTGYVYSGPDYNSLGR